MLTKHIENNTDDVYLKEVVLTIWRKKAIVLFVFILFIGFGFYVANYALKPVYQSSSTIYLGGYTSLYNDPQYVSALLEGDDFLGKVYAGLGMSKEAQNSIEVHVTSSGNKITIAVNNVDPQLAKNVAERITSDFLRQSESEFNSKMSDVRNSAMVVSDLIKQREKDIAAGTQLASQAEAENAPLETRLRAREYLRDIETQHLSLMGRMTDLEKQINALSKSNIVKPAALPTGAYKPNKPLYIVVFGLAGFIIGIFAASFKSFLGVNKGSL